MGTLDRPRTAPPATPASTTMLRWVRANPVGLFGVAVIFSGVLMAVAAPFMSPYDPLELHSASKWQGPSGSFLLGTDNLGRDILSRIIHGSRVSIGIGVAATLLGTAMGSFLGLVSGYRRGWLDAVIQRWVDMMLTLPTLLLALVFVVLLGDSVVSVVVAVGISMVARFTRVIRSVVLSVREAEHVIAATAIGCGEGRIILRHVAPSVVAPSIVLVSVNIGHAMVASASLSFLGVGVQPPTPDWGLMLSAAVESFRLNPMAALAPGAALTLLVLAFNVLGDAIRDTLDPRLGQR